MIQELSEEQVLKIFESNSTGYLGCVLENGEPYVIPVNYMFEDDSIFIHSLPGQKIEAMRKNPRICLQTDKIEGEGFEWQSGIAFGEFVELTDATRKTRILSHFYKTFPRFTPVEANFESDNSMNKVVVFRLEIKRLTGVSESYKKRTSDVL